MSQENVQIVKAAFAAWNAGDMDAFREFYDPDAVLRGAEGWPEPGPFLGREAIMRQWEQQRDAFDTDAVEPISFVDAADRVVVREIWRGAGSGPEMNLEITNVMTVRKGRIVYQEFFWDHAEALEAVGLSAQDVHSHSDTARAMSQENVEIVRAIYEEWGKGNLRAGLDFYDPYVVYVPPANDPAAGCYTGVESFREFARDFLGAWTNLSVVAEEFIEAESSVVVGTHWRGQGQASGIDTDLRDWTVWSFRGPKVIRIEQFSEREEALEAVGLSEQDAHSDS